MRISDWSSDVCSSDLHAGGVLGTTHEGSPGMGVDIDDRVRGKECLRPRQLIVAVGKPDRHGLLPQQPPTAARSSGQYGDTTKRTEARSVGQERVSKFRASGYHHT